MNTSRLSLLITPLLLIACQSMDSSFSEVNNDPSYAGKGHTETVPKAKINHSLTSTDNNHASEITKAPSLSAQPTTPQSTKAVITTDGKQTSVVPNVAPSLGE